MPAATASAQSTGETLPGTRGVERPHDPAFLGLREAPIDGLFDAIPDAAGKCLQNPGAAEELENRRGDLVGRLHLLEFEFVAPGNQRTPHELIGGNDDENHSDDSGKQGAHIAVVGGRLDVAAKAGQLEVARRPW